MIFFSALNLTLASRAERYGHALQTAYRKSQYLQYKSNYTRTWTGKILWVSPSTSSSATVPTQLEAREPAHLETSKKDRLNRWRDSPPLIGCSLNVSDGCSDWCCWRVQLTDAVPTQPWPHSFPSTCERVKWAPRMQLDHSTSKIARAS